MLRLLVLASTSTYRKQLLERFGQAEANAAAPANEKKFGAKVDILHTQTGNGATLL